jgi:hypothetical protein
MSYSYYDNQVPISRPVAMVISMVAGTDRLVGLYSLYTHANKQTYYMLYSYPYYIYIDFLLIFMLARYSFPSTESIQLFPGYTTT